MKFLSVFFMTLLWSLFGHGQLDPWYNIKKIENLEVGIFFAENSVVIQPYYNFHLANYVKLASKAPQKKIVIVHGDVSSLSNFRALKLRDFLVNRLGFPKDKIDINSGLPPSHLVSKGEKLILFLKDGSKFIEKKIKRAPALTKKPLVKKTAQVDSLEYIYINKTPKFKMNSLSFSLGIREYSFSNSPEDLFAWSFNAQYKKRISPHLNSIFDFGYTLSDSSVAESQEYLIALGLQSNFETLNLNTKVYGRKNWAWVGSDSKFATVNDLGLHVGLDFKLVVKPSYSITAGAWAELSLSNTISDLASANVLSFQSEIIFEWFELNTFLTAYRLSRRYEVFDGDVIGLDIGYKF
jgi:hypothetical protein